MLKKIMALVIVFSLSLSIGAFALEGIPFSDKTIDVSIVVPRFDNAGDAENLWFWKYAREYMGINFTVEQSDDVGLYKRLSFASDTMPDLYVDMNFTTNELMTYGVSEGQIKTVDAFMTEETMPKLYGLLQEHPEWKTSITAPDGKIYCFPRVSNDPDCVFASGRFYLDVKALAEMNMEKPETLDELIEALYSFKKLNEDNVPVGASYNAYNIEGYILNALGYLSRDMKSVGLRGDTVVIPYGDKELFGEFIQLMNQFYTDGILSEDYYTMDSTTVASLIAEGRTLLIGQAPYVFVGDSYKDWDCVVPLTSETNSKQQWLADATGALVLNGLVVSSKCAEEKMPALLKFIDWFYDAGNYAFALYGPQETDIDACMGMTSGWTIDENRIATYSDVVAGKTDYASEYDYRMGTISPWHNGWGLYTLYGRQVTAGYTDPYNSYDLENGDDYYRYTVNNNLSPYVVNAYPEIQFFAPETAERMLDLKTALDSFAQEQIAAFVTGSRSLDELDKYFEALDNMGYQEYVKYYSDYYQSYLAN